MVKKNKSLGKERCENIDILYINKLLNIFYSNIFKFSGEK